MAEMQSHRQLIEKKIRKACAKEPRSLGQLAEILTMNKNTLRAYYLYPMVKSGLLTREPLPPAKKTVKYRSVAL